MSSIKNWAESLQKRVYIKWEKNKEFLPYGFSVFYSPVYENPDILILGYNPGGKDDSFKPELEKFSQGDFSLPEKIEYITENYPLAVKMRNIFSDLGIDLEKNKIVKTNLIFFRTPSLKELELLEKNKENEFDLESFSKKNINEIIAKLNPKVILCEGINTFYKLIDFLYPNNDLVLNSTIVFNKKSVTIGLETFAENRKIVGILHPAYRYFNAYEKYVIEFLKEHLTKWLNLT